MSLKFFKQKWHGLKIDHELHGKSILQWLQVISTIPKGWKFIIK